MSVDSLLTHLRQSKTGVTSETGVAGSNHAPSPVSPTSFTSETGVTNLKPKVDDVTPETPQSTVDETDKAPETLAATPETPDNYICWLDSVLTEKMSLSPKRKLSSIFDDSKRQDMLEAENQALTLLKDYGMTKSREKGFWECPTKNHSNHPFTSLWHDRD